MAPVAPNTVRMAFAMSVFMALPELLRSVREMERWLNLCGLLTVALRPWPCPWPGGTVRSRPGADALGSVRWMQERSS